MNQMQPSPILGLALLAIIIITGAVTWQVLARRTRGLEAHVVLKKTFLTGNEREFFGRLVRALPDFLVFPQVSMGALLDVSVPETHPDFWLSRDQFARKICDFVVCDRLNLQPLFIVELDDRMHDFSVDASRDDMTGMLGLKTLRAWSRAKPSETELRKQVEKLLER